MKFYDIKQNTEEWLDLRAGKVTSSKMATIMAKFGKEFGDPAKAYAQHIALERVLGERVETNSYKSSAMQRGHDLEDDARDAYEMQKFADVKNGGFWADDKKGDSPDGLIKNGVIEIKSVEPTAHWKRLKKGGFDTAYQWQIHFHIWCTDSQFCDFISYCPEFPEEKQLYIHRVERDEDAIMKMKIRIAQFEQLVEENIILLKQQ